MRVSVLLLTAALSLSAGEYYSKVEPLRSYTVQSAASGKVVYAADNLEGSLIKDAIIVKIDDAADLASLEFAEANYKNLQAIYETKERNYNKIANMSTKSDFEKDSEKIALLNAKSALLNAKNQVTQLKDVIGKKTIKAENRYLYRLYTTKDAFINPGQKIADIYDIGGSRLTIYVPAVELKGIDKKQIIVDGKSGIFKVDKIWNIADDKLISSYRIELVGPPYKNFSSVVKVDIRAKDL